MATSSIWSEYFVDPTGGISLLNELWNGIEQSQNWQEGVFYALCGAYALVSLIALVQLVRIQMRVPEYGWTTQKVFHLMNFVVNGSPVLPFGIKYAFRHNYVDEYYHYYGNVLSLRYRQLLDMILLDLPGLLFFSTYTLLVLFWAEIYHQARSLPTDKLRPAYFIINGIVYFIQVVQKYPRLFVMLRRFPIESRGRQKKLHEVGFVTGICCTCFLIRCVMVAIAAFDKNADIHVVNHPILDFAYYMIVEILPSALVLFILRKLPPRRVSDQYHPIR
ncbi:hypothetical protein R6Q57_029501 [Mikania cordata]